MMIVSASSLIVRVNCLLAFWDSGFLLVWFRMDTPSPEPDAPTEAVPNDIRVSTLLSAGIPECGSRYAMKTHTD